MRPDGPSWFNKFSDAIGQASFRAAITQLRYKVRYDSRNQWWNITETNIPIKGL